MKKKISFVGLYSKSVTAVGFSGGKKNILFESEMFGATNFEIILGNCLVNAMIFIKKNIYFVKFSKISFYEFVNIPMMMIWSMFDKINLVFSFKRNSGSCVFHHNMCCLADFGLDQHICILNAMICIKKCFVNLFLVSFFFNFERALLVRLINL